ncbi:MAG: F0F1 ATP synthase subunit gamma [Caulobacteraceae bacterium]|nr:F0F1 ATP synthase subunit gamma [Caulobacter sp.]
MPSLKEMRNRIGSVKSTQKITKAMQMVAAAKLRRAQDTATAAKPYAERMQSVIANLAAGVSGDGAPKLLVGTGSDRRQLMVVMTADRGLAGAFSSSVARAARDRINALLAQGKDVKIICVGKKGRDVLRRLFPDRIVATYDFSQQKSFSLDTVRPVAERILQMFDAGEVDVVTLANSEFRSVISQAPRFRQLVPAEVPAAERAPGPAVSYDYEPDEASILADLLPRNIATQLFAALLENQAGFYASQMTAMDNATRNAGDLIGALTVSYNRQRQAQITKELIEIISGAEAL